MPWKSQHLCAMPGCPNLVDAGVSYCPAHRPKRQNRAHYNREWEKISKHFLQKHPLCMECEKNNRLTPATEVHHIIPVADGGTNSYDNLAALCKSCHSRITFKENRFG